MGPGYTGNYNPFDVFIQATAGSHVGGAVVDFANAGVVNGEPFTSVESGLFNSELLAVGCYIDTVMATAVTIDVYRSIISTHATNLSLDEKLFSFVVPTTATAGRVVICEPTLDQNQVTPTINPVNRLGPGESLVLVTAAKPATGKARWYAGFSRSRFQPAYGRGAGIYDKGLKNTTLKVHLVAPDWTP